MKSVEILKQKYSGYETRGTEDGDTFNFVILNPHHNGDIVINNSSGEEGELTFYFSYQHTHFGRDISALMEYIDLFLTDEEVAIEFFHNGKRAFGGSISIHGTDILSIENLSHRFGYTPLDFIGHKYKVCSWSGANDLDAIIIKEGVHVICRKID